MISRIHSLFALALAAGLTWACSGDRVVTPVMTDSGESNARQSNGQTGGPLSKSATDNDLPDTAVAVNEDVARAVVVATIRMGQAPLPDVDVGFSRSVSGRAIKMEWWGKTDERGEARVEIRADNVGGYYHARAERDMQTVGAWSSIPVNGGYVLKVDLPVGEKASVTASTPVDDDGPAEPKQRGATVISDNATDRWGKDVFELNEAAITGDTLAVKVSYSGGCRDHQFTLVASGAFMESDPVQLSVALAHNANNDPCEAWITEGYLFELAPIKALYQEAYRQDSGIIVLQLRDAPAGALVYEFAR
ncbi:MAG: hypothetical protein OXU79_00775 [Gemmatimonadota bacterium]|nr:hypothetical protein [Gemmatimonadota bacterium]